MKGNLTNNNNLSEDGLEYDQIKQYIDFLFESHKNGNITEDELYRQSGTVPYPCHCLLAAQLLLADRGIEWSERKNGYLALLLHDVLEKTNYKLPDWVDADVKELIEGLTIDREGREISVEEQIFSKSSNVQLLILIDMYSSLYEEHVRPENKEMWILGMNRLVEILEPIYENTNLFTIIKATLVRY
jgi:(p)ppGpp synthase/HD superfamily hydrolase